MILDVDSIGKEKRILILTTVSGFLNKFEKEDVRILQSLGYEVHYAANCSMQNYLFEESELEEMGVIFHPIAIEKSPFRLRKNMRALRQTQDLIQKERISAIHCHTPVGGLVGRLAGRKCRKKGIPILVIYTAHGFHFYKGNRFLPGKCYRLAESFLAKHTDVLITINHEDFLAAQNFQRMEKNAVYLIPGVGLDREFFAPVSSEERSEARKMLGLQDGIFFFLSVGEINRNKNHIIVLQALQQMRRHGMDLSKMFYGICGDGVGMNKVQREISDYAMNDAAQLYGYCKDVRPYLAAADAMIFPSVREGLGMAPLEALSMGIPVIAADNRGTREYMQPGKNGWVCPHGDIGAFVNAMCQAMNMDEKERAQMKKACRESTCEFDREKTAAVMRKIYEEWLF